MTKRKLLLLSLPLLVALFAAGCKKKAPAPPPPPPPPQQPAPPAAPMIDSFTADPSSIQRGQSSTLRWSVRNATEVSIDGVGSVPASGSRQVFPNQTTRYRMTAKGSGGQTEASVPVNVTEPRAAAPPPPPPPPQVQKMTLSERLARDVQDAYFDYDKSEVREDARAVLQRNAESLRAILNEYPGAVIAMEGHCDERGSAEYNLGLGDRRATAAKEFLTQAGVAGDRLRTISYGKEKQQCSEQSESCWQKNRRVHFAAQ
jgi:peptidoglycan-associated lipoprotein